MPIRSSTLSRWYSQLADGLEAGLTLERAVAVAAGLPAPERAALQGALAEGGPLEEALLAGAPWMSELDRRLLETGANAGRLPEILRRLGERHEEVARGARRVLMASAYPMMLATLAAFLLPISRWLREGDTARYLLEVAVILVPLWAMVGGFWWAARRRWRPAEVVLDCLPLVRGFRQFRALADLAFVLAVQIEAAVRLDIAWLRAAMAAGDRRLEPVAIAVAEAVQQGSTVAPVLAGRPEIPGLFREVYATAEHSGQLPAALGQLHRQMGEKARFRLSAAAAVYPKVLLGAVGVWIAWQVIRSWLNYFGELDRLISAAG